MVINLKSLLISVAIFTSSVASAQWQVGIKAGCGITSADRSQSGRVDETYSSGTGWAAGALAQYSFTDWLAIRAEINAMDRVHRMDRNINYLDPVHTVYHNTYLLVPVLADFSFGGKKLRGHMYAGGFAGYWLSARREGTTFWMTDYHVYFSPFNEKATFSDEQQRFTAGIQAGAGLSYKFSERWGVLLDAMYCYDLVSYRKSSPHLTDSRYLGSLVFTLGVTCLLF